MNLEPRLTASAVTTTHTINKVAYNKVKRLSPKISLSLPKLKSDKAILNLRLSSNFLEAANLLPFCGLDLLFETFEEVVLTFLFFQTLEAKTYNTIKPAKKIAIPPIPFIIPSVLAKNAAFIPDPIKLGICISATEISTLGKPPTTTEADCKLSKLNTLENIPNTPSTPLNATSPPNPTTPNITTDKKSF